MPQATQFEWTDQSVKVFTQIYSGNFSSLEEKYPMLTYERYIKLKIDEKMHQFKGDWIRIKKMQSIEVVEAIETLTKAGFDTTSLTVK